MPSSPPHTLVHFYASTLSPPFSGNGCKRMLPLERLFLPGTVMVLLGIGQRQSRSSSFI